ncbi:ABC transporter ATP-binding protein [Aliarcobacter skirrowii]|uniref:ABC transporter ATP-binding protein n=1 Tax=Aliarcobacter skirrowii TaxID=28200 RepID=UPI000D60F7DB|nr:ABC transporter ATP-binding protein [Aliarcobacter skirrowii]PWE19130.1 ABC transporter ATP-binding protein [Aliarcobacter skirrowii]PWE25195.1 ABC transporter ATP-binding protein [Aliarcobacter skirrowii]RJO55034.1 ABC transporter ATP-binding protein [Aliarcobacter skirrowii]RJO57045.1 ABC transporter ATP-binding protein [Aliarcobacter skirrowii]
MNKNTAIKVQNLTKTYKLYDKPIDRLKESLHPLKKKYHKDFYALNNVSFEIKKGETVGIIGKNGSGKSTLLKIITGVLTPTSGRVSIHGKISAILELGAGFNPEMTGLENIYLNTSINGMNKAQTDKKIDEIVAFAELGEFIHQPIKTYSSGMKARLAFAVSINVEPDILIVDEALSVGDMNFQAKCMFKMNQIMKEGTTILFVSHSIDSVKKLCKKAIYLENGIMLDIGNAGDIADLYIKNMREKQQKNLNNQEILPIQKIKNIIANNMFVEDERFIKSVESHRYGTGDAKIVFMEILNSDYEKFKEIKFNEEVVIRIYVKTYKKLTMSVNFQIFDDKRVNIVASGFRMAGAKFIETEDNEKYIVEYKLKLPIKPGEYTLQGTITEPIVLDKSAEFIDVIPNVHTFKIQQRENAGMWSCVDLFPELNIGKINE